ncbi:MAG: hypothetical protein ACE5IW_13735 [bacterium]
MAQKTQSTNGDKKRKYKTIVLGPDVFRMSNYGQRDNALEIWLLYFERLGVPAAIIKNRNYFSVWKYGLKYITAHSPTNLERTKGEIVEEVNDFRDYWPKRDRAACPARSPRSLTNGGATRTAVSVFRKVSNR